MKNFTLALLLGVACIGQMFAAVNNHPIRQGQSELRQKISVASAQNIAVNNVSIVTVEAKNHIVYSVVTAPEKKVTSVKGSVTVYNVQGQVIGHQKWRTTLKPTSATSVDLTVPLLFKTDPTALFVFDFQGDSTAPVGATTNATTNTTCGPEFCTACSNTTVAICGSGKIASYSCQIGDTCICSFTCGDKEAPAGGGEQ